METKPGDLEGLAESATQKESEAEAEAAPNLESKNPDAPVQQDVASTEEVPDPDEDDLDDLDDMLDEFTPSKPEPPPQTSKPTKAPTATDPVADGISDEEFANQLQAGMAELMGEIGTSPDMQSQLEQMLKELGGAAPLHTTAASAKEAATSSVPSSSRDPPPKAGPSDESFQETIKKTMERMQNSGDQATAAAASDTTDDILAQMMKAMQSGGLDGEAGEAGEEEFSKMLLGMMEQLTNKEILYEPMKELDVKFPAWMKENEGKVDVADIKRYKEQQLYVSEIVKRFETKSYTDDNSKDREYIVERMQKMQAAGSPPPDLVGDMAAAQEAFGAPEEGCPTQ